MKTDEIYAQAVARERAEAMARLLERGMTLEEVADVYKISKQRVHQIVRRYFPQSAKRGRTGVRI